MEPFPCDKPLIGMVHMLPTPLSPLSEEPWDVNIILDKAREDARILAENGADGIMVENYHDKPFYPTEVPTHTLAVMSIVLHDIVREFNIPVGVNILRNACSQALGLAAVTGASFIRCNVLTGVMITNEGIINGEAHEIIRYREELDSDVKIFADLFVKHGYSPVPIEKFEDVAVDTLDRGGADALILSGKRTGHPIPDHLLAHLTSLKKLRPEARFMVGSGVTPENIHELKQYFDGFIVGTYFQEYDPKRKVHSIVPERVREIKDAIRSEE